MSAMRHDAGSCTRSRPLSEKESTITRLISRLTCCILKGLPLLLPYPLGPHQSTLKRTKNGCWYIIWRPKTIEKYIYASIGHSEMLQDAKKIAVDSWDNHMVTGWMSLLIPVYKLWDGGQDWQPIQDLWVPFCINGGWRHLLVKQTQS